MARNRPYDALIGVIKGEAQAGLVPPHWYWLIGIGIRHKEKKGRQQGERKEGSDTEGIVHGHEYRIHLLPASYLFH